MLYADNRCTYTESYDNGQHVYTFTGPCVITKKTVSVKVPAEALYAYRQGAYIQDALSMLSVDEREFLMSGMSKEGWDKAFPPDCSDDDY